jgi:hypothetical protein
MIIIIYPNLLLSPGTVSITHPHNHITQPQGRRQKKSSTRTSPFPTFWYCRLDLKTSSFHKAAKGLLLSAELRTRGWDNTGTDKSGDAVLSRGLHGLPLDHLPENHPRKRQEANARKRKKNKARKKAAAVAAVSTQA